MFLYFFDAAAQQYFDANIKITFGVSPSQMSTLFFLFALNSAGGWHSLFHSGSETVKEFRIKGGTQRLCEIMADKINRSFVKLGDPVVAINQRDSELADVQTLSGKHFRSERVIVALPPKFAGRIHYAPPLPADRDSLLQMMHAGNSLQFVITYKEVFFNSNNNNNNDNNSDRDSKNDHDNDDNNDDDDTKITTRTTTTAMNLTF